MDVFSSENHFEYLQRRLDPRHSARGTKTRFAERLRIQPAFLSQVLAEKFPLSLEQADLANHFFDHSQDEANFFLLLVSRDRAGTASLKKHFDEQIRSIHRQRKELIERLGRKSEVSDEAKATYYSSWIYSAVHVACTIPLLRRRTAIADYLGLSPEVVGDALDFLIANNLLRKEDDEYVATQNWIRLDRSSRQIGQHHINWRHKAIQSLDTQAADDLHYSGVFSMDAKTAARLKEQFMEFIRLQLKDIEAAKEEDLFVIDVDLFRLSHKR